MPFCRECGKEVLNEWTTCPFCSETIGPPTVQYDGDFELPDIPSGIVTPAIIPPPPPHEIKTICIDGEGDTVWSHEMDDQDLREHLLTAEDFWIVNLRHERGEFVQWAEEGQFEYWCDGEMVREVEPLGREEAIQTLQVQYLNTMVWREV